MAATYGVALVVSVTLILLGASSPVVEALSPTSLIINGKGGGHVAIGFHLAKELEKRNHKVTIIQNSDIDPNKPPFNQYSTLPDAVEVKTVDFIEGFTLPSGGEYDYVFDNNSKAPSGPVETAVLASARPRRCYAYVGSAGIYEKPASHPFNSPLNEDMPVTASKACAEFETALAATGVPHVFFRCQYIYGPHCGKHYLDYFLGRMEHGLPLPIPSPGTQRVSLTDVRDVASQLARVTDVETKSGSIYNVGTTNDLKWNYVELAGALASAAGKKADVKLVDPAAKTDFPFRAVEFFVDSSKSVEELGFSGGERRVEDYAKELVKGYLARGAIRPDTTKDEEALKGAVA